MAKVHPLEKKVARAQSRAASAVGMFATAQRELLDAADELEEVSQAHGEQARWHAQQDAAARRAMVAHREAAKSIGALLPVTDE